MAIMVVNVMVAVSNSDFFLSSFHSIFFDHGSGHLRCGCQTWCQNPQHSFSLWHLQWNDHWLPIHSWRFGNCLCLFFFHFTCLLVQMRDPCCDAHLLLVDWLAPPPSLLPLSFSILSSHCINLYHLTRINQSPSVLGKLCGYLYHLHNCSLLMWLHHLLHLLILRLISSFNHLHSSHLRHQHLGSMVFDSDQVLPMHGLRELI